MQLERARFAWTLLAVVSVACQAAHVGQPEGHEAVSGGTASSAGQSATSFATSTASPSNPRGGSANDTSHAGTYSTVTIIVPVESQGGTGPTMSSIGGSLGGSTEGAGASSVATGGLGQGGRLTGAETGGTSVGIGGTSVGIGGEVPKLWPRSIQVCWSENASKGLTADRTKVVADLDPNNGLATLQRWVREAVENTWGRFADLDFDGLKADEVSHEWPQCALASPSETIQIDFTTGADFADRGMRDAAPTRIRLHVPRDDRASYSVAAIRSFGQAIAVLDGTHGDEVLPYDVALAQRLYARKHSGALVAWGGRCVNVHGAPGNRSQLNTIDVDTCVNTAWQRFRPYEMPPDGIQALMVAYQGAGFCPMAQTNAGTPTSVVTGPCFAGMPWAFKLSNLQWHGWGGLCVAAESVNASAALKLERCAEKDEQRWDLFSNNGAQLRLHVNQRCVSVDPISVSASNGAPTGATLRLAECVDGNTAQNFDLSVHDHIRYDESHCVQVDATQLGSGAELVLGPACSPTALEQMFHVAGAIYYPPYGCLSLKDDLSYATAPTFLQPCKMLGRQIAALPEWQAWDYHW